MMFNATTVTIIDSLKSVNVKNCGEITKVGSYEIYGRKAT